MKIENSILKHYLKNVYFITGTAYAGKSTAAKMLAERFDMILCEENYHMRVSDAIATPDTHPDLCYNKLLSDWREFVLRAPEEYERWIYAVGREAAEFEVTELLSLAASGKRIVVDTNIPLDLLREISDYSRVAVMLSPSSLSVDRFFDRDDPDKQFCFGSSSPATIPPPRWKTIAKGFFASTAAPITTSTPKADSLRSCAKTTAATPDARCSTH